MEKTKILLIEDHLGERLNIMKVLSQFGVEVETAVTFNRALDLIQKRDYNLVISEYLLCHCPEIQGDGNQFWSAAQKYQTKTSLVFIAPETIVVPQPKITGAEYNVLPKPVRQDVLFTLLEQQFKCVKILAA